MDTSIITNPLSYAGSLVVLSGVIVQLWRQNNQLRDRIETSLNSRVEEAKQSRDSVVAPLELLGRQNQLILDKLNSK